MTDSLGNLAGNLRFGVSRFTLNATSGILAPTALTPAVGWIVLGPKSGAHSLCLSSSQPYPNCPYGFLQVLSVRS